MADDDELELDLNPAASACGNCRLWRALSRSPAGGWLGDCRVMPQRGQFGPDAPICSSFMSRSRELPQAVPDASSPRRARTHAPRSVEPTVRRAAVSVADVELGEDFNMTREELKAIIREAFDGGDVVLAQKWEGGSLLIKPGNPELQAKEIPIDALFHKVVMLRDRLRVLEQKLNGHPKLSDAEKVELQQYVTRCYGSLTTFNVLFADKADHFVGDKGSEKEG